VAKARRLADRQVRSQSRRFLAEGPQAVREALAHPSLVVEVFAAERPSDVVRGLRQAADAAGVAWTEVGEDVIRVVADTVTPQGVVAVCRFLDRPLAEVLGAAPRLLAVGVDVGDPGNAGTLLRCADAAGCDAVVLAGRGVDPYNPKAVRASAGSLFHLPVIVSPDVPGTLAAVRAAGLRLLAADAAAATDLDAVDRQGLLAGPTAWLFGNEAHGLDPELVAVADEAVSVPLYGRAESLNLVAAAAVCLYASARAQSLTAGGAA